MSQCSSGSMLVCSERGPRIGRNCCNLHFLVWAAHRLQCLGRLGLSRDGKWISTSLVSNDTWNLSIWYKQKGKTEDSNHVITFLLLLYLIVGSLITH